MLLFGLLSAIALADNEQPGSPILQPVAAEHSGRLLVRLVDNQTRTRFEPALAALGLVVEREWPQWNLFLVSPSPRQGQMSQPALEGVRQSLLATPLVRYAEYDYRVEAADGSTVFESSPVRPGEPSGAWSQGTIPTIPPNDPLYVQQWALPRIDMPAAWEISRGAPEVVVALIDSGYDITHVDLSEDSLWDNPDELNGEAGVDDDANGFVDDLHGWDWVEQDAVTNDAFGHGTHVGGTLAASTDNGIGIASVGRNLKVMPLRILDNRGSGFVSDLIDALDYAQRKQAKIVNLSLVLRFDSQALHDAIRSMYDQGILVVAATGNFGHEVFWPAAYTETLAVAAVDSLDQRADFSNAGPETDIAAPGVAILSTVPGNSYADNSGTSMATPHVSAVAGLIWSLRPDLTHNQVADLIRTTAEDVNSSDFPGPDVYLGWGRINAGAALLEASRSLEIRVESTAGMVLFPGQEVSIPVTVTTPPGSPGGMPARGAVVHYQLLGPVTNAGPGDVVREGSVLTGADGTALIEFVAPPMGGQYTLQLQVGLAVANATYLVWDGPVILGVQATPSTLEVGASTALLKAELQDDAGHLINARLTAVWQTDLGYFDGGGQSRVSVGSGGIFTETLHAGRVSGTAHVTVTVGDKSQGLEIPIMPGPVYRISSVNGILAIPDFGRGGSVDVALKLEDRFGNPVKDDTEVHFYTYRASIYPTTVRTQDGLATAKLTVSWSNEKSIPVWAQVPGSFATFRADVFLLDRHFWFPFVSAGVP
jgi:subtilisin family serine protease